MTLPDGDNISYFTLAGYVLWFDAYVMDANNLVDKLIKPPPLDEQAFRSKVNELIGEYIVNFLCPSH